MVISVFVLLILRPGFEQAPSCFDNIQNEGETGVDCGGPCTPCYIKDAKPLEESGAPQIFKSASLGKAFIAINVVNGNSDLGLNNFYYSVDLVDNANNVVGTVNGYDNILPGESKYLLVEYDGGSYNVQRISGADFKVTQIGTWRKSSDFLIPSLSLISTPTISSSTDQVVVSGTVKNQSAFSVPSLDVTAFVLDKYGDPLFAGKTLVSDLKSFGTANFYVYLPSSVFAGSDMTGATAQVFLSAED